MFTKAFIPFRGYYSTPFAKWQGTLANHHSLELGAATASRWLQGKGIDPRTFDYLYLGYTIHQKQAFYGAPWTAALLGAPGMPGANVSQACSTATTCLFYAAQGLETGMFSGVIALATDRTSNGPHIVWPNPLGPGGEVIHENWLMDNFNRDPFAKNPMIQTAENVAKEIGATKEQCDELTARRYEQYCMGLDNDRAFQKRYLFPVEVPVSKKKTVTLEADEGIIPTTRESLAALRPVLEGGVHSFGSQTHPADGNACVLVTTEERARELSADPGVPVRIVSYGYSRTDKGFMPRAPVPAAQMALDKAGIGIRDVRVIKTHNPFVVNDLYFAQAFGVDANEVNNYGSPLIFGHPQGPTAARCVIEMIEELADAGGGYGLFTGCAAGDTGAALLVKVGA
ncbi:MAG: thiolase family protein [Deferrisomatales bacterium]